MYDDKEERKATLPPPFPFSLTSTGAMLDNYLNAPQQALLLTATEPLLRNEVKRRSAFPEIELSVPGCSRGTQPITALLCPGLLQKIESS